MTTLTGEDEEPLVQSVLAQFVPTIHTLLVEVSNSVSSRGLRPRNDYPNLFDIYILFLYRRLYVQWWTSFG